MPLTGLWNARSSVLTRLCSNVHAVNAPKGSTEGIARGEVAHNETPEHPLMRCGLLSDRAATRFREVTTCHAEVLWGFLE